jgi:Zn-dependent peptidase ImmA (M78 family)
MKDVFIHVISLPVSVRGVTVTDENNDYNIYINANLSQDQQKKALEHELKHIERDDFESFEDIREIENI